MEATEIHQAFIEILEGAVLPSSAQLDQIKKSLTPNSELACVIYPRTQTELNQAIALASKHQIPILTSDSDLNWGGLVNFPTMGIGVNSSQMNQLIDHAVGDLTVTCEAGMKFKDLQNILAKSGQFLAIDPAYAETVTIGEIVNTANTNSFRQRYGGIRDMLLGISFVRADGELVKAGGRVVKNVAGYDLMKLMTGAYGTLGIISQVTFRLYPLPQSDRTVIITGKADAIDVARAKILTSTLTPWSMDIISQGILIKLGINAEIGLIIRFGGLNQGVDEQISRLAAIAQALNLEIKALTGNKTWQDMQNLFWQSDPAIICKIGTLPNLAVTNLLKISSKTPSVALQIHASSGLGILKYESSNISIADIQQIRNLLVSTGGFLTVLEAPINFKQQFDIWGYAGNATGIMSALKQKFDPQNILNPHRFI